MIEQPSKDIPVTVQPGKGIHVVEEQNLPLVRLVTHSLKVSVEFYCGAIGISFWLWKQY